MTDTHDDSAALAALMAPMLRKKMYAVLSAGGDQPELIRKHLVAHLEYMIALERDGSLFASGPFTVGEGVRPGDGLTILRAESAVLATEIAARDPFVRHGARNFVIREWTVNEGSMALQVHFSNGAIHVA
jgi:uncharacterized protein